MGLEEFLHTGAPKQLDVFLSNNPNIVSAASEHVGMTNDYSIHGKPCSDYVSYSVYIDLCFHAQKTKPRPKNCFKKVDWHQLNLYIVQNPFQPYCFSNVNELLRLWCDRINEVYENVPRVTQHRSTLPPWVTSPTSHEIKKLKTLKKKLQSRTVTFT